LEHDGIRKGHHPAGGSARPADTVTVFVHSTGSEKDRPLQVRLRHHVVQRSLPDRLPALVPRLDFVVTGRYVREPEIAIFIVAMVKVANGKGTL
jgi:hypothetical protein